MATNNVLGNTMSESRTRKISCDEGVWLKDRIQTAFQLVIASSKLHGKNNITYNEVIEAIVNGTIKEIGNVLCMDVDKTNL